MCGIKGNKWVEGSQKDCHSQCVCIAERASKDNNFKKKTLLKRGNWKTGKCQLGNQYRSSNVVGDRS